jgi:uncharacterized protein
MFKTLGIASLVLLLPVFENSAIALNAEATVDLEPPADSQSVIVDRAGLIQAEDADRIREIQSSTLRETDIPIVVVTIRSMAEHGAYNLSIDEFARQLFDSWGVGHKTIQIAGKQVPWNRGVLLLVSHNDRKARIELGSDWGGSQDARCSSIMQSSLVPSFKKGEYSKGIVAGVEALSVMLRQKDQPQPVQTLKFSKPIESYLPVAGAALLVVFTLVSLIRRGKKGWAWAFWAFVFVAIFIVLKVAYVVLAFLSSDDGERRSSFERSSSRSGGGWSSGGSRGSFGGGGATGSW